jgi:hypothetical protein
MLGLLRTRYSKLDTELRELEAPFFEAWSKGEWVNVTPELINQSKAIFNEMDEIRNNKLELWEKMLADDT